LRRFHSAGSGGRRIGAGGRKAIVPDVNGVDSGAMRCPLSVRWRTVSPPERVTLSTDFSAFCRVSAAQSVAMRYTLSHRLWWIGGLRNRYPVAAGAAACAADVWHIRPAQLAIRRLVGRSGRGSRDRSWARRRVALISGSAKGGQRLWSLNCCHRRSWGSRNVNGGGGNLLRGAGGAVAVEFLENLMMSWFRRNRL